MFDDLEHYLSTIMAPERIDVVLSILNKITTLTGPDDPVAFSQYSLGVPVEVDPMEELARFDDAIENLIRMSLGELGIVLDDDHYDSGKLPVIERMLFAFEHAAVWQDSERLLAILVDADDREGAMAELIAEINGDEESQYAELMQSVSGDFYNNLLNVIQSNSEADAVEIMQTTAIPTARIQRHFQGRGESFVSRAIRENTLTFGLSYPFYLKFYENYLWDMEPSVLVEALVDFAVCSSAEESDINKLATEAVGHYAETIEAGHQLKLIMAKHMVQLPASYRVAPAPEAL